MIHNVSAWASNRFKQHTKPSHEHLVIPSWGGITAMKFIRSYTSNSSSTKFYSTLSLPVSVSHIFPESSFVSLHWWLLPAHHVDLHVWALCFISRQGLQVTRDHCIFCHGQRKEINISRSFWMHKRHRSCINLVTHRLSLSLARLRCKLYPSRLNAAKGNPCLNMFSGSHFFLSCTNCEVLCPKLCPANNSSSGPRSVA